MSIGLEQSDNLDMFALIIVDIWKVVFCVFLES